MSINTNIIRELNAIGNGLGKYQWPASRITPAEMAILTEMRTRTKTPITELIRQCIQFAGEKAGITNA